MSFTIPVHDNDEKLPMLITKRSRGQYRRQARVRKIQAAKVAGLNRRMKTQGKDGGAKLHEENEERRQLNMSTTRSEEIIQIVEIFGFGKKKRGLGEIPKSPTVNLKKVKYTADLIARGMGAQGFRVTIQPRQEGWTIAGSTSQRDYITVEILARIGAPLVHITGLHGNEQRLEQGLMGMANGVPHDAFIVVGTADKRVIEHPVLHRVMKVFPVKHWVVGHYADAQLRDATARQTSSYTDRTQEEPTYDRGDGRSTRVSPGTVYDDGSIEAEFTGPSRGSGIADTQASYQSYEPQNYSFGTQIQYQRQQQAAQHQQNVQQTYNVQSEIPLPPSSAHGQDPLHGYKNSPRADYTHEYPYMKPDVPEPTTPTPTASAAPTAGNRAQSIYQKTLNQMSTAGIAHPTVGQVIKTREEQNTHRHERHVKWGPDHPAIDRIVKGLSPMGHITVQDRGKEGILLRTQDGTTTVLLTLSGRNREGHKAGVVHYYSINSQKVAQFASLIPALLLRGENPSPTYPIYWKNDFSGVIEQLRISNPEDLNILMSALRDPKLKNIIRTVGSGKKVGSSRSSSSTHTKNTSGNIGTYQRAEESPEEMQQRWDRNFANRKKWATSKRNAPYGGTTKR